MSTLPPQRLMIQKFIQALREQDFLDENFEGLSNLHADPNPLAAFCRDAEPKLAQVEKYLKPDSLDFANSLILVDDVGGNAARVGGKRVAVACTELLERCRAKDCEASNEAFRKVQWEYYILRDCFHHIMQVERTIYFSGN